MGSELKTELMQIRGIGEAKSEQILAVVAEYGDTTNTENVQEAIDYIEAGHPQYALKYLKE